MLKNLIGLVVAIAIGAVGYALWTRKDAEESPLNVMVTQMRTRAIIEHERQVTVWYKACPEVRGANPQVMVIWPAKLNYELDLAATRLSLGADGVAGRGMGGGLARVFSSGKSRRSICTVRPCPCATDRYAAASSAR